MRYMIRVTDTTGHTTIAGQHRRYADAQFEAAGLRWAFNGQRTVEIVEA